MNSKVPLEQFAVEQYLYRHTIRAMPALPLLMF